MYGLTMKIAGMDIVNTLIERETRLDSRKGKTLERRVSLWRGIVQATVWKNPPEVKQTFGTADIVGNNRVVFDICGNNYRIVALINYPVQQVLIRFAGTHPEYDKIDVTTV